MIINGNNKIQNQIQNKPIHIADKQVKMPENKQFELPDIRVNQILLPDNKIYLPKGSKPVGFNSDNLSLEVPAHYRKLENDPKMQASVQAIAKVLKAPNVNYYENTKTGESVIRASKNSYNESGVLDSAEVTEINTKYTNVATKYVKDFEHNTETEILIQNPLKATSSVRFMTVLHKDNQGKVVKTEEYSKSPYMKGIYDIVEKDIDGNENVVCKTSKADDGSITLEKHLVSLDGTKTEYRYTTDKDGMHKQMFCQITDSDGKVLSTIDRTYDKESENVTYSSVNGNKFKSEKDGKSLTITDYTTGKTTVMNEDDLKASTQAKVYLYTRLPQFAKGMTNENVTAELFDTLPADTLLTLHSNITEIIPMNDDLMSVFMNLTDFLLCKTDNFVIGHELGHSKDALHLPRDIKSLDAETAKKVRTTNVYADKEQFRKEYVAEKAAFIKEFPDFGEKFISYFIEPSERRPDQGREETVAESNAINGMQPEEPEILGMRTILLQRYFPRSIAELTKLMNPIAIAEQN